MAIGSYLSIITLNVNGLNVPTKRQKTCLMDTKTTKPQYMLSTRNPESPKQDKPKAKHPKTHINQINKDQTQRTNIKISKGKITNNTQGDYHKDNS